jgi:hypothetical protein
MLAPRNQTPGFCRSNIELGERGALFLSNYMKLQCVVFAFYKLILVNWGHFQAKFHLQYKIYSTVHKAASRQITYVSYYTMLTNESRSKTLICVAINFPYHTFYIHMGTRNHIT